MANVKFKIDGKECTAEAGTPLVLAAAANGVYIPTLCAYKGVKPQGSCRICNVMINNRPATACTSKAGEGMDIANMTPELEGFRKTVVELLFAEGNHFCPACEKSGSCELQALGYRYRMMVPSFPYLNQKREIEAWHPKLMKDHNRCIQCKRCIRGIVNSRGKSVFAFAKRGKNVIINIDRETSKGMSDELAQKCMDICPVGAIIRKGIGFSVPIGKRKYDVEEIGSKL
jgi:[NiFe] hydrogenase diaphorase moiety small subunit